MTKKENLYDAVAQVRKERAESAVWKSGDELEAPGLYIQRLDGKDDFIVTRLVVHIGAVSKITRKLYYANNMQEVHQLEQLHADYFGPIPE